MEGPLPHSLEAAPHVDGSSPSPNHIQHTINPKGPASLQLCRDKRELFTYKATSLTEILAAVRAKLSPAITAPTSSAWEFSDGPRGTVSGKGTEAENTKKTTPNLRDRHSWCFGRANDQPLQA